VDYILRAKFQSAVCRLDTARITDLWNSTGNLAHISRSSHYYMLTTKLTYSVQEIS